MLVKKIDTAIQEAEINLDATNLFDYQSSNEALKIWALPIETMHLPLQIAHKSTDNRLKNRTFFEWTRRGEYVSIAIDKREVNALSGLLVSDFLEAKESIRFAPVKDADSWFENYAELKSVTQLKINTSEIVAQLKEFASLEKNWDSYGAKRIKWPAITKAIELFNKVIYKNPSAPIPFVEPVPDGRIHFTWEVCSKSLMHFIPEDQSDLFDYIIINKSSGENRKTKGSVVSGFEMADMVSNWVEDADV